MRRAGRAACAAAAGWLLCAPARAENATVTVLDELGAQQEEEVISVFAGGRLLGTLHVNAGHRVDSFEASLPVGTLEYTLCGRLERREADGRLTTHPIDNSGRVLISPGQTLRAYTLFDTLFALELPGVLVDVTRGPACDAIVS